MTDFKVVQPIMEARIDQEEEQQHDLSVLQDQDGPKPKVKKTSKGKQKILMKKIEKKTSRQVTFSKRRVGLFKKCDELCLKYKAQIGVIAFSEAGNLFTYGKPNLDQVVERYVNRNNYEADDKIRVKSSLSIDNYRGNSNNNGGFWWDNVEIDNLGLSDLEKLKFELEGLRNNVVSRFMEINHDSTSLIPNNNNDKGVGIGNSDSMSLIPNNNRGVGFGNYDSMSLIPNNNNNKGVGFFNSDSMSLLPNNNNNNIGVRLGNSDSMSLLPNNSINNIGARLGNSNSMSLLPNNSNNNIGVGFGNSDSKSLIWYNNNKGAGFGTFDCSGVVNGYVDGQKV